MIVACIVLADGRDEYHEASGASADAHLPTFDYYIAVDDRHHELGFAGAIQWAWDQVRATDADYVFHLEADFTFNHDVPVASMIEVIESYPRLAQMALMRQPVNDAERAAGSMVDYLGHDAELHSDIVLRAWWLEHRRYFTTNPSVYPRWVVERGWPDMPDSEGHFGIKLLAERPETRFGIWGAGEEWVEHVGEHRTGRGY